MLVCRESDTFFTASFFLAHRTQFRVNLQVYNLTASLAHSHMRSNYSAHPSKRYFLLHIAAHINHFPDRRQIKIKFEFSTHLPDSGCGDYGVEQVLSRRP